MENFKNILMGRRPLLKLLFFAFSDAVLIFFSVWLAFLVRFEGDVPGRYFLNIYDIILLAWLITLPIFYFSKLYHFSWAYVSADELISLVKATGLSFLILTAVFLVLRDHAVFSGFPRSTLFITYFFIFILCGAIRFAKRVYLHVFQVRGAGEKERTLIAGAGDAGEQILRSILGSAGSNYLAVGFVDDSPAKKGILIHGLKVLGKIENIPRIVKEEKIESLIVALPSAGSRAIKLAVEQGRKAGLRKIKVVPAINELITGEIGIRQLREVEMEDLLGREPVSLDKKAIERFICDKKVLITGAAGSIGSELSRQIARFRPSQLLLLDQDETGIFNILEELKDKFPKLKKVPLIADIRGEEKIEMIFKKFRPQMVFHAAAYKHVPLMEENADEAVKNNIFGTMAVARGALRAGAEKFIFISSDKAVNPSSVMGATKRVGEMICQILNKKKSTKFVSVRFGNVLDSRGSVIPIFREQIKKGGPVEVTHPEMKRYFMTTPEACLLVMEASTMGQGGEVFVLDMGKPVRILDLAKEMIRLSGFEPDKDIPIVFTQKRPGEKFFEEILTAEEGTLATKNQKIFIAKLTEIKEKRLNQGLGKLKTAIARNQDKKFIIKALKEIIPTYHGKEI
jgi:FlaA1/EpsC-like NDP-sugar epimerase